MTDPGVGNAASTHGSYLHALHLQRPPFGLDADPAFFYAEPTLMQRLDLLVHLAQFSDRILIITGPDGAGKTSVLQQFMGRASESWRPCAMDSTEVPHRNALLARLASCFGAAGKADSSEVDVEALLERWSALKNAGYHPMVIVDDAHKLNGGTLETLLNLAGDPTSTAARVTLVLVGEEGLRELLARAGLDPERDHLLHTTALPALSPEQTAAYLAYRVAVAGHSGESPFAPTEARAIHKAAGGLPGRINRLAHEHLEEYMARADTTGAASTRLGRRPPRWLLAGLGVVAVAVVLWKQEAINRLFNPGTGATQKTVPLTLPAAPQQQQPQGNDHSAVLAPMPPDVGPGSSAASQGNGTRTPPSTGAAAAGPVSEGGAAGAGSPGRETSAAPGPEVNSGEAGRSATAAAQRPPAASQPSNAPSAAAGTPAPKFDTAPASPPTAAQATPPAAAPAPPKPATAAPTAAPTQPPTPKAPGVPTAHSAAPTQGGPSRAAWLLQQNPKGYTLQLLGARDEASIRRFIKAHHLGKPAMYYQGDFKGAPWYVLLYGVYPNIEAAHKALAALPAKVRQGGPWARRLSAVQQDIRQSQKATRQAQPQHR